MVRIALQVKAVLENVTKLRAEGTDFRWYLKLRCANCGEVSAKWVYVSLLAQQDLKGGRGSASLVAKCKMCSRENSLDILEEHLAPYNVSPLTTLSLSSKLEDSGQFKTIVAFDCRGLEPVDFDPRIGFVAEGAETGTPFNDIDLATKEWTDYDENSNEPVSIFELTYRFKKL